MQKLAQVWDDLGSEPALEEVLKRRGNLRLRETAELKTMAKTILDDLDDLSVLVIFSVFEATVHARAKADVERETRSIKHPAVLQAVKDLKDSIDNGSFGKITDSYKQMETDLTTQVNQVRKFRNWVAHGRRGDPPRDYRAKPEPARDRLRLYLARLTEVEMTSDLPEFPTETGATEDDAP